MGNYVLNDQWKSALHGFHSVDCFPLFMHQPGSSLDLDY